MISTIAPFAIGLNIIGIVAGGASEINPVVIFFQIIGIFAILFLVSSALFKRIHIIFDNNLMRIINNLMGFKWENKKPLYIENISHINLVLNPQNNLMIMQGNVIKLNFDNYSNLTSLERDWLAQEISEWLDIPVTKIDNFNYRS